MPVLLDVKYGAPVRFAGTGIIAITNASKREIYPREFKNELNLRALQRRVDVYTKYFRGIGPFCVFIFLIFRFQDVDRDAGVVTREWLGCHYPKTLTWAEMKLRFLEQVPKQYKPLTELQKDADLLPTIKLWVLCTEKVLKQVTLEGYLSKTTIEIIESCPPDVCRLQSDYYKMLDRKTAEAKEAQRQLQDISTYLPDGENQFRFKKRSRRTSYECENVSVHDPEYDLIPRGMNLRIGVDSIVNSTDGGVVGKGNPIVTCTLDSDPDLDLDAMFANRDADVARIMADIKAKREEAELRQAISQSRRL